MGNYHVRINGEKFTAKEIEVQKDFNGFLEAYRKQASPLGGGKFIPALLVTGVLITALVLTVKHDAGEGKTNVTVSERKSPLVDPPLKGVTIPYDTFTVDASKGGEWHYKTGSVLKIPAHAFLGKDGKPASGKVSLRYREFHDAADIFLSGIQMTYDSAGTRYHFESAGMMELLAFAGDEPLRTNPGTKITVNLASGQTGDYFNVYYLDTAKKNWSFIKRDTAGIHRDKELDELLRAYAPAKLEKKLSDDISGIKKDIAQTEKYKPLPPLQADPGRFKIKVDVKEEEFPEIMAYKDVLFQVAPEEKDFKPEYAKQTWEDVRVEHAGSTDIYLLTFTAKKEKHSFLCRPVLEGKNYTEAKGIFEKLREKYLSILDERQKKLEKKQKQLEALHKLLADRNSTLNDSLTTAGNRRAAVYEKESMIMRAFTISNFGIWNCDCPTALPKGMLVNAKFTDSTGRAIHFEHVYLVEKGRNALFTYYSSGFNEFRYNPKKQNMIWAVTPGNQFAFFPAEAFKSIKIKNESAVFVMKVSNKKFSSADEVKSFMKI